jgi:hypothetical protein
MQAIISPSGSHGQGDLFLRLFLAFLRDHHAAKIRLEDYKNAEVVREDGRIDLLIYDEKSRKAIIIENKINGASDMDRQVVRYLEKVSGENYTCDAIVYLCLNQRKPPDQGGWLDNEKEKVKPLLRVVCAFDDAAEDVLHTGWLTPCIEALNADDSGADPQRDEVAHVLRQYQKLILKLGRTLMNKPIMEDFYRLLQDKPDHASAIAVAAMVNHLPAYRCTRLVDRFCDDPSPFHKLYPYPSSSSPLAVFHGLDGYPSIKLHVDCTSQDGTTLGLWNNAGDDPQSILAGQLLKDIGLTDSLLYDPESEMFTRRFSFPSQETELFQFIRDIKEALKERLSTTA